MDVADQLILERLQQDSRITQQELAREVGLAQPTVAERIRKLEHSGVIRGYVAKVDATMLGKEITAFVGVSIEHPRYFDEFTDAVLGMDDVLECHRVAGEDSYLLKVKSATPATLDDLLVGKLRLLPGVTRTYTTIVLRSIKEETLVRVAPATAHPATK
ncbi:MAG: Lrp/AsnC family transcriptional regulator [Deltaproteobacteria bacterium]|nr:Lrp/AsnC family transcriptional regulator [Deltaproteobacteria bacterium]